MMGLLHMLLVLLVVVLVGQATALKCYQAPLSWEPCWSHPNGQHGSGRFKTEDFFGDSRFMMAHESGKKVDRKGYGTRKKCTIPCGGVGLLPREKMPAYEIKTACSACTWCEQFSGVRRDFIEEKEACEMVGCCEWEKGAWGGYCNAAKTGLCTAESTHQGGASSRIDGDTELVPQSGIACKVCEAVKTYELTYEYTASGWRQGCGHCGRN